MAKADLYSSTGTKKGSKMTLPKSFDEKPNLSLLAQAIRVYESKRHPGMSKTKTRGEVSASTAKIWRQKGTGRARHGAVSAPIFVGGGKAHGPTPEKRELAHPTKKKKKTLDIALSMKVAEEKLFVVDSLDKLKKTKEAQKLLDKVVGKKKNTQTIIALGDGKEVAMRAFRNIKNIKAVSVKRLNAYDVFHANTVLMDVDIFAKETKKTTKKKPKTVKKETKKK